AGPGGPSRDPALDSLAVVTRSVPETPLVVVCGLDHVNLTEEQEVLGKAGVRLQSVVARTEAEYLERCRDADAVLIQYGAITRRGLEGLPRVRVLVRQRAGAGGHRPRHPGGERSGLRDRRGREPRGRAAAGPGPQGCPARPPDSQWALGRVPHRPRDPAGRPDRGHRGVRADRLGRRTEAQWLR